MLHFLQSSKWTGRGRIGLHPVHKMAAIICTYAAAVMLVIYQERNTWREALEAMSSLTSAKFGTTAEKQRKQGKRDAATTPHHIPQTVRVVEQLRKRRCSGERHPHRLGNRWTANQAPESRGRASAKRDDNAACWMIANEVGRWVGSCIWCNIMQHNAGGCMNGMQYNSHTMQRVNNSSTLHRTKQK